MPIPSMSKSVRVLPGLLAILLILGLVSLAARRSGLFYNTSKFSGDGRIADHGLWSYPRWIVTFPEISLSDEKATRLSCRGLPPAEMTFSLEISSAVSEKCLASLATQLEVAISDGSGRTVGRVKAPICEWIISHVPATGIKSLWRPEFRVLSTFTTGIYTIEIHVMSIDVECGQSRAIPKLAGGGNELP